MLNSVATEWRTFIVVLAIIGCATYLRAGNMIDVDQWLWAVGIGATLQGGRTITSKILKHKGTG